MEKQLRRGADGIWRYLSMDEAMAEVGMEEVDNYVSRHQKKIIQLRLNHPIMILCMEIERRSGERVYKWWWKQ